MVVLIPFSTEDSDPGADSDERGVVGADERMDPENTGEEDDVDKEDELAGESTRMGARGDLDRVFHRYQPLKAGNIETYWENLEDDAVLVHQQCFLVSLAEIAARSDACVGSTPSNLWRSLSIERDPVHLDVQSGSCSDQDTQDTSKACAPGLIHPASECTQPVRESEEISIEVPARHETKLRGVDSTVG
ncbi:hypothetical protein SCLCIDRAFT_27197 [Scleroderma citrinum Foug A]|uniref:Uncharacterized protein n=1 Tax=Scleroderma citrinum Foug A TaxID=1036808 RepID=A0A0C3DG44_9AGAM|nr:hypothetical protein SCLCIDRAFT_27197 [Scleroderma citrinum Foug A]